MSLSVHSLIGCRISIISKAKIRYEGNLESVDFEIPTEPVITLSRVWSFGTEDRVCDRPVAPMNEEYSQVVFRGRDLEDVHLVQSSVFLNEDSAIVSAAPGSTLSHPPSNLTPTDNKSATDHSAARISDASTANLAKSVNLDNLTQNSVRTPTSPFQLGEGLRLGPVGTVQPDGQPPDARGPRPFGDGRSDADPGVFNASKKIDYNARGVFKNTTGNPGQNRGFGSLQPHAESSQSWGNRDHRKGVSSYSGFPHNRSNDYQRDKSGGYNNQWSSSYRSGRGSSHNYQRWGGRSGGHQYWGKFQTGMPSAEQGTATFTNDYDIEKANAELAAELEKINISIKSNSNVGSGADTDADKSNDSNHSVTGEETLCYDKSKSFFDTISSEMMDRANGVNPQGMNRRDERLLNSTTFGTIPPTYNRRMGGYSGHRSYGYGQRRNGMNQGGYRRPGGSGHKNFSNNNPLPSLSTAT